MKMLTILFLFFSISLSARDIEVNEVRSLFLKSSTDEASCKKLLLILDQYDGFDNVTFSAYKACATMMMAKYCFNPVTKLSYFNKGKSLLEKCVRSQSENIEVRYLRFTVQTFSPDFLGYNTSIQEDKGFLLKHLSSLKDMPLKEMIFSFLNTSKHLSSIEKHNLKYR